MTGSNHVLPTCGAARGRGGLTRGGFRARLDRAAPDGGGPAHGWRRQPSRSREPKGSRARRLDCRPTADPTIMSGEYKKPSAGNRRAAAPERERRRLLAAVFAVLRSLTAREAAFYPDYDAAQQAVARVFAYPPTMCSSPTGSTKASSLPRPRRSATDAAGHSGSHRRRAGVRHVRGLHQRPGWPHGERAARPRLRVSVGRPARGDHATRASSSSPTLTTRPVSRSRSRTFAASPATSRQRCSSSTKRTRTSRERP